MHAETALMLFSLGSKRKAREGTGSPERAKAGLRSGVNDEVHGAHMEGDALVLSEEAGGGRYPMRPAGRWVSEETDGSAYRLVFQPTDLLGRRSGELMVSKNSVSRRVVEKVMSISDPTGMLCVYTPDREAARALISAVCPEPVEFPQSSDVFESSFPSMRCRRAAGRDGGFGPICLFGECAVDGDLTDEDGERGSDARLGFHIEGKRRYVLSPELGGTVLEMRP